MGFPSTALTMEGIHAIFVSFRVSKEAKKEWKKEHVNWSEILKRTVEKSLENSPFSYSFL